MMTRRATHRCLAAVLLLAAFGASACGTPSRTMRPSVVVAAVPPLESGADASTAGHRLSFANQRYRAQIFASATKSTAVYASPPDLLTNAATPLSLDVYRPVGDASTSRPLLVWVHGGGFAYGNRDGSAGEANDYARLGYVTASIDYRLDPGNHCLQVQAGLYTGDQLVQERARCLRAIVAARDDAAAAIVWLRAHAATYGIDITRVAIGGDSAGAITAIHVGQTLNTPGGPPPADVAVRAVLAMSGCNYLAAADPAWAIDSQDAPIAVSASGGDSLVPFSCSIATVDAAAAVGTPVLRSYYALENAHAQSLYYAHRAEIERSWRAFLIDHLGLA